MAHPRRPRRTLMARLGAALAALALVAAGVIGGSLAAQAAPSQPVITTYPSGTDSGVFILEGTITSADPDGGWVGIMVTNSEGTSGPFCVTGAKDYPSAGTDMAWACAVMSMPLGVNTFTAIGYDDDGSNGGLPTQNDPGPASDPVQVVVGGTAAPSITSPADGTVTDQTSQAFTGTGPEFGTIDVEGDMGGGYASFAGCNDIPIDGNGDWSCTATGLSTNTYTVRGASTTAGGTGATTATQSLQVDLPVHPGDPTITAPADGTATTATTALVSAYVDDWQVYGGGSVEFTVVNNGSTIDTCSTGDLPYTEPSWDCTVSLDIGDNEITAISYGAGGGDASQGSDSITITRGGTAGPTITSPSDGFETTGGFTVSGTGPALGTVTLWVDGEFQLCTDEPVDASGAWSCTTSFTPGQSGWLLAQGELITGAPTMPQDSNTVTVSSPPDRPSLGVALGPSSMSAFSSATPGVVGIELYSAEIPPDWYYVYTGPASSCPDPGPPTNGSISCDFGGLTPGVWVARATHEHPDGALAESEYFVRIPTIPSFSATPQSDGSVRFSGTAGEGDRVVVRPASATNTVCSATAASDQSWSCTAEPGSGTFSYRALSRSQDFSVWSWELDSSTEDDFVGAGNGWSSYSPTRTVDIMDSEPSEPSEPSDPPQPPPAPRAGFVWSWLIPSGTGSYAPGDTVSFTGSGVPAGATVTAELHSTPVVIGSTTAAEDGTFQLDAVIPLDAEPGDHQFVLSVDDGSGEPPSIIAQPVVITEAAVPPVEPVDTDTDTGTSGSGSGAAGSARNEPAAPNVLSDALPTLGLILSNPGAIAAAGGIALAVLFLVAIPAELLTATLAANAGRMGRGFAAIRRTTDRVRDWFVRVTRSRALAAAILVAVVSTIFGFSDPDFGFDLSSLRLVLALALAFFLIYFVVSWLVGMIVERRFDAQPVIAIEPSIVVFAALGVLLSRLVGFTPGIFIGVVIGIELLRSSRRAEIATTLLQFAGIFALSVGAWLGLSALRTGDAPTDFWGALLADTLAAITVEGLTGLAIAALPLAFLEGRSLWIASKPLWAGTFLVIATAFALLVLPTALAETDPADIGGWYLVLAAFGIVTFALWGFFAWRSRTEARNTPQHDDARR